MSEETPPGVRTRADSRSGLGFWPSIGLACLLSFALGFLSAALLAKSRAPEPGAPPAAPSAAPAPATPAPTIIGLGGPSAEEAASRVARYDGISFGREDAPVVVYEFTDYQCPACAAAGLQFLPEFHRRYVDTGRVRIVYVDFPLIPIHPLAVDAALAARCANEQDRYLDYTQALFARQAEWAQGHAEPTGLFVTLAEEQGLDRARFEPCLRSRRYETVVMEG
jgi:protein-disulfide isomerase